MLKFLRTLAVVAFALSGAVAAQAAPVTFVGTAQINALDSTLGLLDDFLGTTPSLNDVITFSVTYDSATLGPAVPGLPPDIAQYAGGITSFSMTLNGVTLVADTTAPGLASVLVTTSQTPVLGIPFWFDGYGLTGGSPTNPNGDRWSIGLFFYYGALTNLDPPTTIPTFSQFQAVQLGFRSFNSAQLFDGFGAQVQALTPAPEPSLAGLVAAGLGALSLRAARRSRSR